MTWPAPVPIEHTEFASTELTEVEALLRDRYTDYRSQVVGDDRDVAFKSRSASAGGLRIDQITYLAALRVVADPHPRFTMLSLHDGHYESHRRLGPGESELYQPDVPSHAHFDRIRYDTVQLPTASLHRVARRSGVAPKDFRFDGPSPVSAAMNRHWTATVAYLKCAFAGPDPAVTHPLLLATTIETAVTAALAVFPNPTMNDTYNGGPGRVEPAAVRRAVAYMDAHAGEPITLDDIAAAAGVSARALQAGFRRHRETTPIGYLRRARLERAHRDLQAADRARGDTVAAIARRWGYRAPGRFAAAYRQAFGRSPRAVFEQMF